MRRDLVYKVKKIEILLEYLPQQSPGAEILELFREAVMELGTNGMKYMRKVMFTLLPVVKGNEYGKFVCKIIFE